MKQNTLLVATLLFFGNIMYAQTTVKNLPQRPISTFTKEATQDGVNKLIITFYGDKQPVEKAKIALLTTEKQRLGTVYNQEQDTSLWHFLLNMSTLTKGSYYFEKVMEHHYKKPIEGSLLVVL